MSEIIDRIRIAGKKDIPEISDLLLGNPELLQEVFIAALSDHGQKSWRSAWVLNWIGREHPELIKGFIPRIIAKLPEVSNHSLIGNYLNILNSQEFDLENNCQLIDFCVDIFNAEKLPKFLKYYAMKLLMKFGRNIPELKEEVIEILNFHKRFMPSAHLKWTADKFINELKGKKYREKITEYLPYD